MRLNSVQSTSPFIMEKQHDPNQLLTSLQQLLQQIKRLATFAYSESNAFALTLLNRKRLELEENLVEELLHNAPPQQLHKSHTLKSILLCYRPSLRRRLKAIDSSLEHYYKEGLAGLQNEVENLINLITPGFNRMQVS